MHPSINHCKALSTIRAQIGQTMNGDGLQEMLNRRKDSDACGVGTQDSIA